MVTVLCQFILYNFTEGINSIPIIKQLLIRLNIWFSKTKSQLNMINDHGRRSRTYIVIQRAITVRGIRMR